MTDFRIDQPWRTSPLVNIADADFLTKRDLVSWLGLLAIFFISAYVSVGAGMPSSTPVHHDDYTNYAAAATSFNWSVIRPLSSAVIHLLSWAGPEWLIGAVRLLTVTYVWLIWKLFTLLVPSRSRLTGFITFLFYGVCVFSTPIIPEYARYTGMITHLISGSLGVLAVLLVIATSAGRSVTWLRISGIVILLSVFAKEDFVILYALTILVAAAANQSRARPILIYGGSAVVLCLLIITGTKLLGNSAFLGQSGPDSSYYLSLAPSSIVKALFVYLTGASHPAMNGHAVIIATYTVIITLIAVTILLRYKRFSWTAYFICASFAVAFPYALLPNHINAYYELIWLPFLVAGSLAALFDAISRLVPIRFSNYQPALSLVILTFTSIPLLAADLLGRKSIAAWYEQIAEQNSRNLSALRADLEKSPDANIICVTGATAFSPWYMHNGAYLTYVLGKDATWRIEAAEDSPLYAGFQISAQNSTSRIIIVPPTENPDTSCLRVNWKD